VESNSWKDLFVVFYHPILHRAIKPARLMINEKLFLPAISSLFPDLELFSN
jgi:hypothetical protein